MRALTALPSCASAFVATMSPSGTGASSSSPALNCCTAARAPRRRNCNVSPSRRATTSRFVPLTSLNGPGTKRGAAPTAVSAYGNRRQEERSRMFRVVASAEIRSVRAKSQLRRGVTQAHDAAQGGGNRRRRAAARERPAPKVRETPSTPCRGPGPPCRWRDRFEAESSRAHAQASSRRGRARARDRAASDSPSARRARHRAVQLQPAAVHCAFSTRATAGRDQRDGCAERSYFSA